MLVRAAAPYGRLVPTPRRQPSSFRALLQGCFRCFRGARREGGTATLELVVATLLAGLLVSASVFVLAGGTPARLASQVCAVVSALDGGHGCAAAGSSSADPAGPTSGDPGQAVPDHPGPPAWDELPLDPKPEKCKVKEHEETSEEAIKIGFIKLGASQGLVVSYFSDGSVSLTATDGAEISAEGGFGGGLDLGKLRAGASVSFGAGLNLSYGSTWTVPDEAEAQGLEHTIRAWMAASHQGTAGAAPIMPINMIKPPPPPTETVRSVEIEANASGSVGLSLPWETDQGSGGSGGSTSGSGPGGGEGNGSGSADLASVGIAFGGSKKWTQITNTEDGTKTYTTDGTLSGDVSASTPTNAIGVQALLGSSLSITRDAENQITAVEMTTTKPGKVTVGGQPDVEGGGTAPSDEGDLTVATSHLDVTTPEQRAIVDRWVGQVGSDQALVPGDTLYPKKLVPGDDFQNLMYTHGVVSNVVYKVDAKDQKNFSAEVKVGVAFGVEFSSSTKDTYATDASYLDAADGGERPAVDFGECIAR